MRGRGKVLLISLLAACLGAAAVRAQSARQAEPESGLVLQVAKKIVAGEQNLVKQMGQYTPRVETYIQEDRQQKDGPPKVTNDYYFLGWLRMSNGIKEQSMLPQPGFGAAFMNVLKMKPLRDLASLQFHPEQFGYPLTIDLDGFDLAHYRFEFVRREFLGDVRCLVFDVRPRVTAEAHPFVGRIWVEDQGYHIVRFNGAYGSGARFNTHFDSWREELQPGLWLPFYIYSEESNLSSLGASGFGYRAQTRFWGYQLKATNPDEELTRILVDAPNTVKDETSGPRDYSPLTSKQMWVHEAAQNVLARLQKGGLLAPPGPVDKVLETVVNNLIVTNHLDSLPPVHCRVLLTYPLESLTVGDTILVSRGLIDVLPNEASLAMILAHELGHIVLGHTVDTKYAFDDRMMMSDSQLLQRLDLKRTPQEEHAADAEALKLLRNSPYKDQLGQAGLFLEALAKAAPTRPRLMGAHLGNRLMDRSHQLRMAQLMEGAPVIEPKNLDQIAALPLGSRIVLNPWNDDVRLQKSQKVTLLSPRDKMPFDVTPLFPYLTRLSSPSGSAEQAQGKP
jgi:Peptidase family M48